MEQAISFSVSPIQLILAVAFQVWMIVFPIILIRKINYLTEILQERIDPTSSEEA